MLRIDDVLSPEVVTLVRGAIQQEQLYGTDWADMNMALDFIKEFEEPMRDELERLATSIVFNNFPVFMNNKGNVRVKVKLVDHILPPDLGDEIEEPKFCLELLDEYRKRKLANMITQGAGVNTHGIHHLRDDFKTANPELVESYDIFDRLNRKHMRSAPDDFIQGMSGADAEGSRVLGWFRVEHKLNRWTIHAEAVMMPVLVHEVIKGMYELISMHGLPSDYRTAQRVMEYTDTKKNEILDLKYGETIYAMVRDFVRENFHDRTDRRPEVLEYYIQSIYEKPPLEMIETFEGMITGRFDPRRARAAIDSIYKDLERDDAEI